MESNVSAVNHVRLARTISDSKQGLGRQGNLHSNPQPAMSLGEDTVRFSGSLSNLKKRTAKWMPALGGLMLLTSVAGCGKDSVKSVFGPRANETTVTKTQTANSPSRITDPDVKVIYQKDGITQVQLPTGQTITIIEDHSKPIVGIGTGIPTGSLNETRCTTPETKCNNGISHLLEHEVFKGTEKRGPGVIDKELEGMGAEINAFTSNDITFYHIQVNSQNFAKALDVHADMLMNSVMDEAGLVSEQKVVQEEIRSSNNKAERKLLYPLINALFGEHPYGMTTIGPPENIPKLDRQQILDYYHYWYQPKNFSTVIVGDITPKDAIALVKQTFQTTNPKKSTYTPPKVPAVKPLTKPSVAVVEDPIAGQEAYFTMGFQGTAFNNHDQYALDMAMQLLGGGRSARLHQTLKEQKNLLNSISTQSYTLRDSGVISIDVNADPANFAQIREEIARQVNQLKTQKVSQSELKNIVDRYRKQEALSKESIDQTLSTLGWTLTTDRSLKNLEYVNEMEKVTPEDIQRVANKYLDFNKAALVELVPPGTMDKAKETSDALSQLGMLNQVMPQNTLPSQSETQTQVVEKQLANGAKAILKPNATSDTVALEINIKNRTESIPGTASVLAEMMMRETKNRTTTALAKELESKSLNIAITPEKIQANVAKEDLGELMMVLNDMLNNPSFSPEQIKRAKEDIRTTLQEELRQPQRIAIDNLLKTLNPNGVTRRQVLANLDRIGPNTVKEFYKKSFVAPNMVVTAAGNFDSETMSHYLETLLKGNAHGKASSMQQTGKPTPKLQQSVEINEQFNFAGPTWISRGWQVPDLKSEDYAAMKVLATLLGDGLSSRVSLEIRERGLTYTAWGQYLNFQDNGVFALFASLDPNNTEKTKQVLDKMVQDVTTQKISPEELQKAKDRAIGVFEISHDTNMDEIGFLSLYETKGLGYQQDKQIVQDIEKVTAEDVLRVAKKYLSGPSATSIATPGVQ